MTKYEIESIDIISEILIDRFVSPTNLRYYYEEMCPTVKIKFKTGDIIETYLHTRKCWRPLWNCLGEYNFTGNMTEYGWENKCTACESRVYGPIIICLEELKKQVDEYNNKTKSNIP